METTEMLINRWMVKQTVKQLFHGVMLCNRKEQINIGINTCNNLNESPGNNAEWKKKRASPQNYIV